MRLLLVFLFGALTGAAVRAAFQRGRRGDRARIRSLAVVVTAVVAGDLSVSSGSTRRDALGDAERGVDELIARLRQIVGTVRQGVERFHDGRLNFAEVKKAMLDTAELTAGQAYDAGVSAEQVSASVQIVAMSTEDLVATVNDIARHATAAADIAVLAAAQGEAANDGVHQLGAAVQQVESVADVIRRIAAQTHLLALNAMIEAARAGDAGRGFAVVAAEVKDLSRATAEATEQVLAIVAGIQEESVRASAAIKQITDTMAEICISTSSIATSVTEQTATTREIGRVSSIAADGAADISRRVTALHDRAREVAYVGASDTGTRRTDFALLEAAFEHAVDGFAVHDVAVQFEEAQETEVDREALNAAGTSTQDGVTTVLDYVVGTGLNQFTYTGAWLHGLGYETDPCGDAYSSVPGDRVELRFVGRRIRFYGFVDKQQGMADVWVDDAEPTLVDFYSPERGRSMLWESPELPSGEHTFQLVVSTRKHPDSRYFWNSVAMVEIVN